MEETGLSMKIFCAGLGSPNICAIFDIKLSK